MIRLVFFIVISVFFLFFIVLNLGENNRCDISFGFKTFTDIPVFLSTFFSFTLGMLFSLPLIFSFRRGKKKTAKEPAEGVLKKSGGFFGGKNKKGPVHHETGPETVSAPNPIEDELRKSPGSYGID